MTWRQAVAIALLSAFKGGKPSFSTRMPGGGMGRELGYRLQLMMQDKRGSGRAPFAFVPPVP